MAINKAKIITVTSAKGGTGKSTTVLNLAGILSENNKKTIIVDLDLYSGIIAMALNLKNEKNIYSLVTDLINNKLGNIEDYVTSYNENIDVLSSPIDPRNVGKINSKYIEIILKRLELKYEVILIDSNHILDSINLVALDASDEVLYVMTNDLMDIKNMRTINTIFENMEVNYKLILNLVKSNNSYTAYDIKNTVTKEPDYVIPKNFYNPKMENYIYEGKIMTLDKSYKKTKGYNELKRIIDDIL